MPVVRSVFPIEQPASEDGHDFYSHARCHFQIDRLRFGKKLK